jgi:hypothetical protein
MQLHGLPIVDMIPTSRVTTKSYAITSLVCNHMCLLKKYRDVIERNTEMLDRG